MVVLIKNNQVENVHKIRIFLVSQTIPMYRLFNPNSGEHFYTRNTGERDDLRKIGWNYEGIGWYSYKGANGIPVSRLYNKKVN